MLLQSFVPRFCRKEAFEAFVAALAQVNTTSGLMRAAIAVSAHALDDVQPERIEARLAEVSARVNQRVRSPEPEARLAHLHEVFFNEEGYAGNFENYYSALNSYLPAVLTSKRGLPLTLCLLYKVVGEAAGLAIEGVNAPGHFLARVFTGEKTMIIDPFFGGECLSEFEAWQRLEQIVGEPLPHTVPAFPAATHEHWLTRLILNLQVVFKQQNRLEDLAAMGELQRVLQLAREQYSH